MILICDSLLKLTTTTLGREVEDKIDFRFFELTEKLSRQIVTLLRI